MWFCKDYLLTAQNNPDEQQFGSNIFHVFFFQTSRTKVQPTVTADLIYSLTESNTSDYHLVSADWFTPDCL